MTLARSLRDWLRPATGKGRAEDERWIVLDTETSGLDPVNDRLLAIGAVAVDETGIRLDDSFEVVLRSDFAAEKDNVVIHGIGHEAQSLGIPAGDALGALSAFVAEAPCVGFHSQFDQTALDQCARAAGVPLSLPRWLDLALLAAALLPEAHRRGRRSLDDWLTAFDIGVVVRHNAAGDALATAELLLRLRAIASLQRVSGFDGLVRLSRQHRWLGSSSH